MHLSIYQRIINLINIFPMSFPVSMHLSPLSLTHHFHYFSIFVLCYFNVEFIPRPQSPKALIFFLHLSASHTLNAFHLQCLLRFMSLFSFNSSQYFFIYCLIDTQFYAFAVFYRGLFPSSLSIPILFHSTLFIYNICHTSVMHFHLSPFLFPSLSPFISVLSSVSAVITVFLSYILFFLLSVPLYPCIILSYLLICIFSVSIYLFICLFTYLFSFVIFLPTYSSIYLYGF